MSRSTATSRPSCSRGRGITIAGSPERGAVVARANDLVHFARQNGYRTDELIRIIESVG